MRIVPQHVVGSGIILDADGYILTNAHVVEGSHRIEVVVPPHPGSAQLELSNANAGRILEAKLIGKHRDSDIALLKVEATNLAFSKLRRDVPVH
jgi:serine protease Do